MDAAIGLVALTAAQFAGVVALFLPGFVSLKVDRLIHPSRITAAADQIVEIVGYSILNAGVFGWLIVVVAEQLRREAPNYLLIAPLASIICVVGPIAWPFLFRLLQRIGVQRGWLIGAHRFAWDNVFSRGQYGFVIVHLVDGSHIGGYFGERSYATVEPESGHLYLEELWSLDETGGFVARIPDSRGAIFRPSDYKWVELFEDDNDEE